MINGPMPTKLGLSEAFAKDSSRYYSVELFKKNEFSRKMCRTCGHAFWSTSEESNCGDSSHNPYSFIGKRREGEQLDYAAFWKKFASFWKKAGHEVIPRYPVISRWRDDLYFTIASIVDFQRLERGKVVFEYPANPLMVPQICLRFVDIANVGVTGRHLSCFTMAGQHAFQSKGKKDGYWMDECIQHNYNLLTQVLKIPKNEITYVEDLWAMPDFSAYGPSMESFSGGLELVNSVFMNYRWSNGKQEELPLKVIDVGWGFERLLWFYNGTPSVYDSVFPREIAFMKKQVGLSGHDDLFRRYSKLAAKLNVEEVKSVKEEKQRIAKDLGVSLTELEKTVLPLQNIYAIADHSRALLFALSDGALPSNSAGGYNLRVLARRAFSFIENNEFQFELYDIMEKQAREYRDVFPELSENLVTARKILDVEKRKFDETTHKATKLATDIIKAGSISSERMMLLYESHGLTPEIIERVARQSGSVMHVPTDFYHKLTEKHVMDKGSKKRHGLMEDPRFQSLPKTRMLYYDESDPMVFKSKVLAIFGDAIVLEATAFYPEGGGQVYDTGELGNARVIRVEKVDDIILHYVDKPNAFAVGKSVQGAVNETRRRTIMRHHTSTHLLLQACMRILGSHVWQAGARKDTHEAHLDITHYEKPSREQVRAIELLVNETILKRIPVTHYDLERGEAERKYGFRLYTGAGAIGKTVRVIDVKDFDVQCCGGTHVHNTGDIGFFKIKSVEQVQDGVIRIRFVAGLKALELVQTHEELLDVASSAFSVQKEELPKVSKRFFDEWKQRGNELDRVHRHVADHLADRLISQAKNIQSTHIEQCVSLPSALLTKVALQIAAVPGFSACLYNEHGVVTCAAHEKSGRNALDLLRKLGAAGGGTARLARGKR